MVALQWFTSFLHRWGQRVALEETMSTRYLLGCGVSQRTVLSQMLFNIYMHSLAQLAWSFRLRCHSPLLFDNCMEPLVHRIWSNPEIKGLQTTTTEHKVSMFANDMTLAQFGLIICADVILLMDCYMSYFLCIPPPLRMHVPSQIKECFCLCQELKSLLSKEEGCSWVTNRFMDFG